MESQATTSFQPFAESKAKDIELHNYLAQWKNKHNRNKYYRKEDFCYDGLCTMQVPIIKISYIYLITNIMTDKV